MAQICAENICGGGRFSGGICSESASAARSSTSDARFVKDHCPVVEFGLVGKTMHQVDERVEVAQIHQLKSIYTRILQDYFA